MLEEAQAPFDLAQGPLIRARIIRMKEQEHILLLVQHHIVTDGWSMRVFARELGVLYRAFFTGRLTAGSAESISRLCGMAEERNG